MLKSIAIRYLAIVLGTIMWDVGAILQKRAVSRMPAGRLPVLALLRSREWMLGLLVTAAGWGLFVFGLDEVPISAARAVTAGSYVVLAVFSTVFLRTPLSFAEWAAIVCVTGGILMLGVQGTAGAEPVVPPAEKLVVGVALVTLFSIPVYLAARFWNHRRGVPLFAFAAFSGLLGSVGDLLTKVCLALAQAAPHVQILPLALAGVGLAVFYLTSFYMLSRAYQSGTVVGAVVVSDLFGRVGVLFLGSLVLSEPIGGGFARAAGFFLVLGGSLFLGRFGTPGVQLSQSDE